MAKCSSMFNKSNGCRFMTRPYPAGGCDTVPDQNAAAVCVNPDYSCSTCNSGNCSSNSCDPCVNPPTHTPKCLTLLAPVIFDECGINLCKVMERSVYCNPQINDIQVRVLDIDFNTTDCDCGSRAETLRSRPACTRITLSHLKVKLAVQLLDRCHNIIESFVITEEYLPSMEDEYYDEDTNPSSICLELYTPYGLSYETRHNNLIPSINFIGMEQNGCSGNNALRQGIVAQGLAKVVRFDADRGIIALGLTLYLKSLYFVQYRMAHEGLVVPPKCTPYCEKDTNVCKDFVEGCLLSQNISPLPIVGECCPQQDTGCDTSCC